MRNRGEISVLVGEMFNTCRFDLGIASEVAVGEEKIYEELGEAVQVQM